MTLSRPKIGAAFARAHSAARWAIVVLLALCLPVSAFAGRDPAPSLQIPLNPIGYLPILPQFLAAGNAMATVHYADQNHLLVTFNLKHLLKRDAEDPPEDEDRTIGAYLVELPSGRVMAHAEWRTHDRGQYLWELGGGRFLLRIRDTLSMLDPLGAVRVEDSFRELPFLHPDRHVLAIMVSPEHDLLTLETSEPPKSNKIVFGDAPRDEVMRRQAPVQISFYRLHVEGDKLLISTAGMVRSQAVLALPVDAGGFVDALEGGRGRWMLHFSNAGKTSDLGEFDSTCFPHILFVSAGEFIAFGCRGSSSRQTIGGFNLNGDYMWQQSFFDVHITPTFAFAPTAGRFALGRTLVTTGAEGAIDLSANEVTGQEVRVYQTYNGKILFRTACTPAMRSGQNFALSPDGLHLAVLRETTVQHKQTKLEDAYASQEATIDIYDLPALSERDQAAVKEEAKYAPVDSGGRIDVAIQRGVTQVPPPAGPPPELTSASMMTGSPAAPPEQPAPLAADPSPGTPAGDVESGTRREVPTLYAPGEQPQAGSKGKASSN